MRKNEENVVQLEHITTEDISQIALWNVELHEDEGSTPMTVDGAEARLRKWLSDDSFQARLISIEGWSVGYLLYNNNRRLHLDVKATNSGGQKFWEALGFVAEHVAYTRD